MRHLSLIAAALLSLSALAKGPPEAFSADVVVTPKEGEAQTMKMYLSKDRARMEMDAKGQQMVVLSDFSVDGKAFMLMPSQKMAMDLSGPMAQAMSQQRTDPRAFRSSKDGNPCVDPKDKSRTCKKIGKEQVDGRETLHWEISENGEKTMDAWIDQELMLMVKAQMPNGDVVRIQNIQPGAQPSSLFEVPKDYRVMSMPGMAPGQQPPGKQPRAK